MVLTLLVAAPAAMAGTRARHHPRLLRRRQARRQLHRRREIRDARNNLPADVDQYSDCRDVLARALGGTGDKSVGGGSGGGGALGGGGGGSDGPAQPLTPSGPEEQAALDKAALAGGDAPVQVGDGTVVPGAAGSPPTRRATPSRASLLAVLILLGLAAFAAAVPYVRRRVLARRLA